ncbi:MAG: hypothetical protein EXR58_07795 [Chloroflexi bacterium]|nr:hypothetical protein [Chloroflexota bacterium]
MWIAFAPSASTLALANGTPGELPILASAARAETISSSIAASPVYRLSAPGYPDHVYTLSSNERDVAQSVYKYAYEGIAFALYGDAVVAGAVPIYRLVNPGGYHPRDHRRRSSRRYPRTGRGRKGPGTRRGYSR